MSQLINDCCVITFYQCDNEDSQAGFGMRQGTASAAVTCADLLILTDEDTVLKAKKDAERLEPLRNSLEVQKQRIREHCTNTTEEDWMLIEREYTRLYAVDRIIRTQQQLHGYYKEDLFALKREIFGLHKQIEIRDKMTNGRDYFVANRVRVSRVVQSHAHIFLIMSIPPASPVFS